MVQGGGGGGLENRTMENLNVVAIGAIILITTFGIKWRDMRQIKCRERLSLTGLLRIRHG